MLGSLLLRARKEKNMTKVALAEETGLNVGHLTHIEKGQRNPTHKTLKAICRALHIPYQPIASTYDRIITEDQVRYKLTKHISYDKVPLVDGLSDFIECPDTIPMASFAVKVTDDVMEPTLKKDSYAFVELNANLNNKDIAYIQMGDEILLRRFIIRRDKLVLRADNKEYEDIDFDENSKFTIIGRVIPPKK